MVSDEVGQLGLFWQDFDFDVVEFHVPWIAFSEQEIVLEVFVSLS